MCDDTALFPLLKQHLQQIYKEKYADAITETLVENILASQKQDAKKPEKWNEKDSILITYAGSIRRQGEAPLKTLERFLKHNLYGLISCVHILPFFPYSSDDGFSVIDYKKVDPELGDWNDIKKISLSFDLMFDLVINHISQKSEWFQNYLKSKDPGKDFFIEVDPSLDLSQVVRPRSLPLLTAFETCDGRKHLWTTFSSDQIDLNFANPQVLLEMLDILVDYINKGSRITRLDAIAFLWKETGTSCLHRPETHEVVKLIRKVAEAVDPTSIILTETNVPNRENLSYFGNNDEAHMVYQFSLPPLLLHALHTGTGSYLTDWLSELPELEPNQTFFNFTASHDGIGVRPLEGLLPDRELDKLVSNMQRFGGKVSTKTNVDGTESPYELNITYFDALKGTSNGEDEFQVDRFLCSQTIMMALKGIPAFYIHSLTATPNYYEGVEQTGRARTINRRIWQEDELNALLQENGPTAVVFKELKRRIAVRSGQSAFHPNAMQRVWPVNDAVFSFIRGDQAGGEILVLANLTNEEKRIEKTNLPAGNHGFVDILSGEAFPVHNILFSLKPYQVLWLKIQP